MRKPETLFKNAENTAKRKGVMTFEQLQCIILFADELGRFDEAIKYLTERDFAPNEKDAQGFIQNLAFDLRERIDAEKRENDLQTIEDEHAQHIEKLFNKRETY